VDLKVEHKKELEKRIQENYFGRNAHVVQADCNDKLIKMSSFLKENQKYRTLAFIDPYGMSVNWSSIEKLKSLGIDLWMLIPTGIGVNRLLKKDGNLSEAWVKNWKLF
jgi:three-Cys-motif partner protein